MSGGVSKRVAVEVLPGDEIREKGATRGAVVRSAEKTHPECHVLGCHLRLEDVSQRSRRPSRLPSLPSFVSRYLPHPAELLL